VSGQTGSSQDPLDDRQLDRVMSFFERLWQHLVDMVRTLQDEWARDKDFEGRQPPLPDAGRKQKT
jgi:hypothetical protein